MSTPELNQSLDDIIKSKPKNQKRGGAAGAAGKARASPLKKRGGPVAGKAAATRGNAAPAKQQQQRKGNNAQQGGNAPKGRGAVQAVKQGGNSNQKWTHDKFQGSPKQGGRKATSPVHSPAASSGRFAVAAPIKSAILSRAIPAAGLTTGVKVTVANLSQTVVAEDLQELFGGDNVKLKSVKFVSEGVCDIVFTRREDAVAAVQKYDGVLLDNRAMILKLAGSAPVASPNPRGTQRTANRLQNSMQF